MSKTLSVATVIEKNKIASGTPFLVCLDVQVVDPMTLVVVETLHFVRNSEDIVFNGVTYDAAKFEIQLSAESGGQQEVHLTVIDYFRVLQARMQAYGGGVGFNVTITVVNSGTLDQPPEVVEYFQVTGASTLNYEVTFVLGAENAVAQTFPRRRQTRDYCGWRYKSQDCGYTGSLPSCDLSLKGPNGCSAHSNAPNFGGFFGINSTGTRYA